MFSEVKYLAYLMPYSMFNIIPKRLITQLCENSDRMMIVETKRKKIFLEVQYHPIGQRADIYFKLEGIRK